MRNTKRKRGRRALVSILVIASGVAGYSYWILHQPVPILEPISAKRELQVLTASSQLSWPGSQAAVGIVDTDILDSHGSQTPVPIASTTKMITALVVLEKKPLALNQTGPSIPITEEDVQRYRTYLAQGGSVAPVQAGISLTQYQMLQAILLPSANNVADSLAIWAYGSLEAYRTAANEFLAENGLTQTKVGSDASGLAPDSTSTARDLVRIGTLVMKNPVLAQIVGQSETLNFPVAGTLRNTNYLLGTDGIVGLKTGSSDQAGGAFIGAAQVQVDGTTQTLVTAVIASQNRQIAMRDSANLIRSARANFASSTVIKSGQVVGTYRIPWGGTVDAIAKEAVSVDAWKGSTVNAAVSLTATQKNPQAGQTVGIVTAQKGAEVSPVELAQTPPKPSIWWRLTHPLQ